MFFFSSFHFFFISLFFFFLRFVHRHHHHHRQTFTVRCEPFKWITIQTCSIKFHPYTHLFGGESKYTYFWLCDYNSRANRFPAALSTGVNVISIFDDAVRNNLVCVCVCYWIYFYFLMKGKYRKQRHNFLFQFLGRTESGCNFALNVLELCCVVLCCVRWFKLIARQVHISESTVCVNQVMRGMWNHLHWV